VTHIFDEKDAASVAGASTSIRIDVPRFIISERYVIFSSDVTLQSQGHTATIWHPWIVFARICDELCKIYCIFGPVFVVLIYSFGDRYNVIFAILPRLFPRHWWANRFFEFLRDSCFLGFSSRINYFPGEQIVKSVFRRFAARIEYVYDSGKTETVQVF
jgi:hypothetical protein